MPVFSGSGGGGGVGVGVVAGGGVGGGVVAGAAGGAGGASDRTAGGVGGGAGGAVCAHARWRRGARAGRHQTPEARGDLGGGRARLSREVGAALLSVDPDDQGPLDRRQRDRPRGRGGGGRRHEVDARDLSGKDPPLVVLVRSLHEETRVRLVDGDDGSLLVRRELKLAGRPGSEHVDRLVAGDVTHLGVDDPALLQEERALLFVTDEGELAGFPGSRYQLNDVRKLEFAQGSLEGHETPS